MHRPWSIVAVLLAAALAFARPSPAEPGGQAKLPPAVEAFFEAAMKGDADGVRRALKAGLDANTAEPSDGATALMVAAYQSHLAIVRMLLEAGAKVNMAAREGLTPLMLAASAGHAEVIKVLVEAGADVNAKEKAGLTALMLAIEGAKRGGVRAGRADAIKALLSAGADVQAKTSDGRTALAIASDEGFADLAALLKDAGAVETPSAAQPFIDAVIKGSTADVHAMLKDPTLANAKQPAADRMTSIRQMTVLQLAATRGHVEVVAALLEAGADVNARSAEGTALVHAAEWTPAETKEEIVTRLLKAGADARATDTAGWAAIHHAAADGSLGTVRALLKAGVDVDSAAFSDGDTPLTIAAFQGHTAVVVDLIKIGATVNHANLNKRTALMLAAAKGDVGSVRALLAAGADVNAVENNGGTALAWAKSRGNKEVVDLLVAAGAKR
jgi:hypothetical protein